MIFPAGCLLQGRIIHRLLSLCATFESMHDVALTKTFENSPQIMEQFSRYPNQSRCADQMLVAQPRRIMSTGLAIDARFSSVGLSITRNIQNLLPARDSFRHIVCTKNIRCPPGDCEVVTLAVPDQYWQALDSLA